MVEILSQTIFQINCIQKIISELSEKLTELNIKLLNECDLRKILLKIIYCNPTVFQNSFSFLIDNNGINILVSWDIITKIFDVNISSVCEASFKVNIFVQDYIGSGLVDIYDFEKLSVLFGDLRLQEKVSKCKINTTFLELKTISVGVSFNNPFDTQVFTSYDPTDFSSNTRVIINVNQ